MKEKIVIHTIERIKEHSTYILKKKNDSENENKTFKLQLTFIQEKMKQIEMDQNFCLKKNYEK